MAKSLNATLTNIERTDSSRGRNLRRFYETMRSTLTLEMMETGSWRKTIEVLDAYTKTGHVLEKYRLLADMYDNWLEEFGKTGG